MARIVLIRGGTGAGRRADAHVTRALAVGLVVAMFGLAPTRPALAAVCGDNVVEPPETCDPPGSDPQGTGNLCRSDCTYCGDGQLNAGDGEDCDAGSQNGSSYPACCSTTCTLRPYACRLDDSNLCMGVVGITSTDVTSTVSNVVRVRNKFRINTPFIEDAKILFSSRATFNPATPGSGFDRGYSLDVFYDRLSYLNVQFTQSDYYDYVNPSCPGGPARIGLLSGNPQMFPVISGPIDCGYAPQVGARSQVDVSGKDIVIEFVKGGTLTGPVSGWGACTTSHTGSPCASNCPSDACGGSSCDFACTPSDLPAGTYQIWNGSMTWDGVTYPMQYALPASQDVSRPPEVLGFYADPRRLFNFRTEFFEFGKFVQFLLWDMEVQQEGSSTWVPITEFKQGEPGGPSLNSLGARVTVYNNRPVLEISNDGSDTYHVLNDVFSIPPDVSGVPPNKPRIEFSTNAQVVHRNQKSVKVVAKLDHTSTSNVKVALKLTGTPAGTGYVTFPNPAILTIPPGSLKGTLTFNLGGVFPGASDRAVISMNRSCEGMIGTVPAETLSFAN